MEYKRSLLLSAVCVVGLQRLYSIKATTQTRSLVGF